MNITFPTLQDTVLTQHVILSGDGIELGEKIYYFLKRIHSLFINKPFLRIKKGNDSNFKCVFQIYY